MKRLQIIVFFIILLAVVGCCPTRHLPSTQDSVRVETVVRTEIYPDTVFVEVPIESERQTVRDTTSHLETSYAVSDARITPRRGIVPLAGKQAAEKARTDRKEVVCRDSLVYRDKIVEKAVPVERELTWWQQTQIRGFWVAIIIILVLLRKKIFPLIRRFI